MFLKILPAFLWTIQGILVVQILGDGNLDLGLDKAVQAFDIVCDYDDNFRDKCHGEQARIVHNTKDIKDPNSQMNMFKIWSTDHAISKLPKPYQENCEKFLSEANADPPGDESELLEDGGNVYPYKAYAHCLLHTLRGLSNGQMKRDWSLLTYGMEQAVVAFDWACDYEDAIGKCQGEQKRIMDNVIKFEPRKKLMQYFKKWTLDYVLAKIPKVYQEQCEKYLTEVNADTPIDESEILKDEGKHYPYKAYAHCLLHTLRINSKGEMKLDRIGMLHFGMDMVIKAFDMACNYGIGDCKGLQAEKKEQVLALEHYRNKPKNQMETFAKWSKDALARLPKMYEEKCQKYLSEPEAPPESDESKEMEDKGRYYPFKAYCHCLVNSLRDYSRGVMKRDPESLYFGMDMTIKAFDMACDYGLTDCQGRQAEMKRHLLEYADMADKPKTQMDTFADWSKDALAQLPTRYKEKCEHYLHETEALSEFDESTELGDEGKMYPFKAYAHCLVHTLREVANGVMRRDWSLVYFGMEKAVQAYDMVCDYESSNGCNGKQLWIMNEVLQRDDFKNQTKKQLNGFGSFTKSLVLPSLPKLYQDNCEKYLSEPEAEPKDMEREELNDSGKTYFYRAYAYCLVHTLRESSGGIMRKGPKKDEVKSEGILAKSDPVEQFNESEIDKEAVLYGIEKAVQAFDIVCDYDDNFRDKCHGEQARIVHNTKDIKDPKSQMNHFKIWSTDHVISKLPKPYQDNCEKFLSEANADPTGDESALLEDGGNVYPYKAYAHCLLHTLRGLSNGQMKRDWSLLTYGMEQAVVAFDLACDYEDAIGKCKGEQKRIMDNVIKFEPRKKLMQYFKKWTLDYVLAKIPKVYQEQCEKYLTEVNADTPIDESEILKDEGKHYPYKAYAHCLVHTLRINSKGEMKRDRIGMLHFGMEKVVKAFDIVCDFSDTDCSGRQEERMNQVLAREDKKDDHIWQMKTYASWSDSPLKRLPVVYKEKCGRFLKEYVAEVEADEGAEIEDEGKNYPLKAYAHCLVHTLREVSKGAMRRDWSLFLFGMDKSIEAYKMACDYQEDPGPCDGSQAWIKTQVLKNYAGKPKKQLEYFGHWSKGGVLKKLSSNLYEENCKKYLSEIGAEPSTDESKILEDEGKIYPYKAYAHCLLATLRTISNGEMRKQRLGDSEKKKTTEVGATAVIQNEKKIEDKLEKSKDNSLHNGVESSKPEMKPADIGMLHFGMEKVVKAFDMVCDFSDTDCSGNQEDRMNDVRGRVEKKDDYNWQMKTYISWSNSPLKRLPAVYNEKCGRFLKEYEADVEADESKELQDEGKNYPLKAYAHCLVHTLREVSNGAMKRDWNLFHYGMEKSILAYKMACDYEDNPRPCHGSQAWYQTQVLAKFPNSPKKQLEYFGYWSKGSVLKKLSSLLYEYYCEKYLSEFGGEPPADESKILEDEGKIYPYKAYAHCLLDTLRKVSGGAMKKKHVVIGGNEITLVENPVTSDENLQYGFDKAVEAFDMACDFEDMESTCQGEQLRVVNNLLSLDTQESQIRMFQIWSKDHAISKLPKAYQENCEKFLSEPDAQPPADESALLDDDGKKYPYKAYAHCLVQTLRTVSNGKMQYNWDWIYYGMEQVRAAHARVCGREAPREPRCKNIMNDDKMKHIRSLKPRKVQTKYFRDMNVKGALPQLDNEKYKENCEKYLSNVFAEPPADKSKILEDADDVYPYKAYAHCLLSLSGGSRWESSYYGVEKAVQAHDMACSYERSPTCERIQLRIMNEILQRTTTNDIGEVTTGLERFERQNFENETISQILPNLPKKYQENCVEYISSERVGVGDFPVGDEGEVLHDKGDIYTYKAYSHCLVHTLREISNGEMYNWDMLNFGIDKITVAYDMACAFSKSKKCQGVQARASQQVLARADLANKMAEKMKAFAKSSKNALVKLPAIYSAKCMKLLSEPNAGPVYSNESAELDDDGKFYPFKAYTHCLLQILREGSFELMRRIEGDAEKDWSTLNYGMEKAIEAFDMVCKYEMSASEGARCGSPYESQANRMMNAMNDPSLKDDLELLRGKFSITTRGSMATIDDVYGENCSPFIRDTEAVPKKDMGKDFKDDGKPYIFKAYAHCMVQTLRERTGILAGMTFIYDRLNKICWYQSFRVPGRISVDRYFNCKKLLVPEKIENLEMMNTCVPEQYHDCTKYMIQDELTHDPAEPEMVGDADVIEKYKQVVHCLGHIFRKTHGDKALSYIMKSDKVKMESTFKDLGPIKTGIDMVAAATLLVCWQEHIRATSELGIDQYVLCRNRQKDLNKKWLHARDIVPGNLDQVMEIYRDKCKIYLTLLDDEVLKSESEVLNDHSHGEYPYKPYAHCLISTLREQHGDDAINEWKRLLQFVRNSEETPNLQKGIEILERVVNAICWYEYLRNYGSASSQGFMGCQKVQKKQTKWLRDKISRWSNPEFKEAKFLGRLTRERSMPHLPQRYGDDCSKYLDEPSAAPISNEGDIVNDNGDDYPFKAFAYCLISTLRSTHGDNAADIVKNERIYKRRHWKELVFEQHNTLRKLHGVEPLEMNKELNQRAQDMADVGPIACDILPIPELENPNFHGGLTDENIGASPAFNEAEKDDIPLLYATEMYEMVNNTRNDAWANYKPYNFEKGFRDDQSMANVGHDFVQLQFTKIVWKGTKQVGFGYAYNGECTQAHRARFKGLIHWPVQIFGFFDIRYFPKGNEEGKFRENVFPRKQ